MSALPCPARDLWLWAICAGLVTGGGLGLTPAAEDTRIQLPGEVRIRAKEYADLGTEWHLSGYVDVQARDAVVQADTVVYRIKEKTVEATGNVVLSFPGAVLAGSRLIYRIEEGTGLIEDVVGYLEEDGAILRARKVERIGPERIRVERATFTSCTQPTPYWSFRIRRGIFHLGHYAYLRGVSFNTFKAPVFYSPYLVWPIKDKRAAGLLFPHFATSDKLGKTLSVPFYWPITDNAEATLLLDGHTKVGPALGIGVDWLPTWRGRASGFAYIVNDQVREKTRYRLDWRHRQWLPLDFQLKARIETISDFDYLTDYETDLTRSTSPQTLSRIDLTRHWSWYSLSLRAQRQKQYFTNQISYRSVLTEEGVNTQLPEIELRGRSQRLGKMPVFLSFESSLTQFQRQVLQPPDDRAWVTSEEDLVTAANERWRRFDLAPKFTAPLLKSPWADLSLDAGWRGTWYSGAPDPENPERIQKRSVSRTLWSAGISFTGPRFQRVFDTSNWDFSPKLKHVVEPFVRYDWRPESATRTQDIVVIDQVDVVPSRLSDVTYGLRQRFFVLRPPETSRATGIASAKEISFKEMEKESEELAEREAKAVGTPAEAEENLVTEKTLGPLELASLEISQYHSFIRPLTVVYGWVYDPDTGTYKPGKVDTRSSSPITARARFNPSSQNVIDLTYEYDPGNDVLLQTSISTMMTLGQRGYFRGSWYRRNPPFPGVMVKSSFLRSQWGYLGPDRRFSLETAWDYNFQTEHLEHQSYVIRYTNQCSTFQIGYDLRSFPGNTRRQVFFTMDLSGLGKILDLRQSLGR